MGEKVVIAAHSSGAVAGRSAPGGMRMTKRSVTTTLSE